MANTGKPGPVNPDNILGSNEPVKKMGALVFGFHQGQWRQPLQQKAGYMTANCPIRRAIGTLASRGPFSNRRSFVK
jgi:hypothetical protein